MSAPDTQGLPWPQGEPGAVRAAAHRAGRLAHELGALHGRVAATHATGWSGAAAAAFGATVLDDAAAVGAASSSFGDAAGALNELAAALEHARERVRHAARRLAAARSAARTAAGRAADARSAADAAHAAAALDPTAALGSPLTLAADSAEGDAQRAEAASGAAQAELARVQSWAEGEAQDACHDARAADQRCAGVLDSAAATAGSSGGTGIPGGGGLSPADAVPMGAAMAPIGQLGAYLAGDLYNFWSGGHDRYFPFGSGAKAAIYSKGIRNWVADDWKAYQAVKNSPISTPEEIAAARGLMLDSLPTFNNGAIGTRLAGGLSRIPATAGAGRWLATAGRATPWFRGLGIAGGVVSTGLDGYALVKEGNPIKAFDKRGAGYLADIGKTAFSASSTAFLIAPNPVTGGAVIVSGGIWLGAEGWEHRKQIGHAIATGADYVWDHSVPGELWNNRQEIGHALDQGVDTIGDGLSAAGHGLADAGSGLVNAGGGAVHEAESLIDEIPGL